LGFSCIKIKIGAIDFHTEFNLIKHLRNEYSANDIEIRVDANGGFSPKDSLEKLKQLSKLDIHSIEQPIAPGQYELMAQLCEKSPIPIALDEELIGINDVTKRLKLLQIINPKYIILKPSLLGGFASTKSWINLAKKESVDWWITSALESNIGLNAIAQWTYALGISRPQGLGTGKLFFNNIDSPLEINNGRLFYLPSKKWKLNL
jgi:L-alanine-DL-glutamate epimerase-like enolase superfamily enzyme